MEQDLNSILQDQLRGLHMPDAISWWPPAPGWWLLFVIALLLLCYGIWSLIKHQRNNRYRKQAIAEIQVIRDQWIKTKDTSQYVQSVNAVIKRAIMASDGSKQRVSTSGQHWVKTINCWAKKPLSKKSSEALIDAGYKANPEVDIEELHQQISVWLRSHKKPKEPVKQDAAKGTANA